MYAKHESIKKQLNHSAKEQEKRVRDAQGNAFKSMKNAECARENDVRRLVHTVRCRPSLGKREDNQ
jgi:hypothetical protein